MLAYFVRITPGKMVLWCYLLWYLVTVFYYYDPAPRIWLNSLGISVVIGIALLLSVSRSNGRTDYWQVFRLFLMPFCVSSFSSLIKGAGFFFIFPPRSVELLTAVGVCLLFLLLVLGLKKWGRKYLMAQETAGTAA